MPVDAVYEAYCERDDCWWIEHYRTRDSARRALNLHQQGLGCQGKRGPPTYPQLSSDIEAGKVPE